MVKGVYGQSDKIFYTVSGIFLTLLLVVVSYPLVFIVSASFSSGEAVSMGRVTLLPVGFNLDGYRAVFRNANILRAYINTIFYTAAGTLINVVMVMFAAYPLSRRDLKGRGVFMLIFVFTMFFNGGMIPMYIQMNRLGLLDTIWAMLLPGALPIYSMIIARTFLQANLPHELFEAACLDGCSDAAYFRKVVLPLSKAVLAVIALFSAVAHWNSYFNAMMYLNTRSLLPLQLILRDVLVMNQVDLTMLGETVQARSAANLAHVLKYSLIVVATAPILCLYPFLQKYFVTGVMIGSLKG